jgi:hypothetical protein
MSTPPIERCRGERLRACECADVPLDEGGGFRRFVGGVSRGGDDGRAAVE